PFETRSPCITSGIRIGVPAATTKGMGPSEMKHIAGFIDRALKGRDDESTLKKIEGEVMELCKAFPFYAKRLEGYA
ncbi:MAG: serine hydroxymethyltransferase, partial [Deltaproteobacteria bacterium]|nr:serine hydroxymethyltransferase [Deltaproteobacteria bacterium]